MPAVLPELTEADLKELGLPLGPRKLLLKAIAALPGGQADAPADRSTRVPGDVERRQLTVLFCDLVGSTALSAQLDPEDMREVLRSYQDACAGVITRFEGHVAKFMGDGVLAYFGYPKAHENDSERAVRAGLGIIGGLAGLATPAGEPLAVRIGIATGLVMVGELIGEGAAQEQTVVGDTPNLAARLQALAAPSDVVISHATRRLVGGMFEVADLGARSLKGFAEPIRAFRVVKESASESRFEALRGRHLTPLVGREHEIGLLLDRWERAKEGEGQVALLSGEPGIGKSRSVRALRERLADEEYIPLSHYCSPFHINSALYPVVGLLERSAGFVRDDTPESKLAKLEGLLLLSSNHIDAVVPLIASLLGFPTDEKYPPLDLTPQRQRKRTLEVLVDQVEGLARRGSVLAIYEDVHWADPSTLEILDLVIERVQRLPVLALITFRPEFNPPWTGHAHVTQLSLSRLTRRHGSAMIEQLAGGKTLPADLLAEIVERTDGVPLFVEEMTKSVLESGLLREGSDHFEIDKPLPSLSIPTSLHDSLMARLDRLAAFKEVVQIGAVIGREFSYELLAAVSTLREADLGAALDQLVTAELVFRRGTPPDATYSFKHALVQDAAYESLLKSKRQKLHGRVAVVLEKQFSETAETKPELLAHHFAAAKLNDQATAYYLQAGHRAVLRATHQEAINLAAKGLKLLDAQPDTPERRQRELALQITLGPALMAARGFGASEVERTYKRAYELCQQLKLGESPELLRVLYGLRRVYTHHGALKKAHMLSEECLRLAQCFDDKPLLLDAYYSLGATCLARGELILAESHLDKGSKLGDDPAYGEATFGTTDVKLGPICRSFMAWLLWARGYPEQSGQWDHDSLTRAREQRHYFTEAHVLFQSLMNCYFQRNVSLLRERAGSTILIAREHGFPQWAAWAVCFQGWALAEQGRKDEGIMQMRRGLAEGLKIGTASWRPHFLGLLAEILGKSDQIENALRMISEALDLADEAGEYFHAAELHRHQGNLLLSLSSNKQAEAEVCFGRALSVAQDQQARSWELRAATSLARLWAEQGGRERARELLSPVYGWFTEGFDTPDLKDAKILLDKLA